MNIFILIYIYIFTIIFIFLLYYIKYNRISNTEFYIKDYKIPFIIHQTIKKKNKTDKVILNNISVLKKKNPNFKYILYDDNDCIKFLRNNYSEKYVKIFNKFKVGAAKADFFRYCVLYKLGGIYLDIDTLCLQPLINLIEEDDTFIIPEDKLLKDSLFQAIIMSTPNNTILKQTIDTVIFNIDNNLYKTELLKLSGPTCIGKVLKKYINKSANYEFTEGIIRTKNQKIKILTHYMPYTQELIKYKNKSYLKCQIKFNRDKSDMKSWTLTTMIY